MNNTNPFTTTPLAATTRLLLRAAPRRAWLTLAITLAVCSTLAAIGLVGAYVRSWRPPRPITIIATPTPALRVPTATPAPTTIPQPVELADGTVLAYGPDRGWYVVREAPATAAPPTAEPEIVVLHEPAAPAERQPEPVATELPPIYDLSAARESAWHPPLVYAGDSDACGGPDVAPPACH